MKKGKLLILIICIINFLLCNDIVTSDGDTRLHCAAYAHDIELIQELLKSGAEVNSRNRYGKTPLHSAIYSSIKNQFKKESILVLLKNGANPNLIDYNGKSSLDIIKTFHNYKDLHVTMEKYAADFTTERDRLTQALTESGND